MKSTLSSLALLGFVAACPASIDNVDGLAGGAITSKISVPSIETTAVTTESLDATGDVTAASVSTGSVTASGAVTGSSIIVQRGNARVGFFGLIVGAVARENLPTENAPDEAGSTASYGRRHEACAAAFPATEALPAAHVCLAQEAMAHALQSPDTVPATVDGAVVHTYASALFAPPDVGGTEQLVSDCGAMNGRTGNTNSALQLHRRVSDDRWSLRIENNCFASPVACCQ